MSGQARKLATVEEAAQETVALALDAEVADVELAVRTVADDAVVQALSQADALTGQGQAPVAGRHGAGLCQERGLDREGSRNPPGDATRKGIAIARSKGKLKGKKPKLTPSQRKHPLTLPAADEPTQAELAELFNVSRTTIYRELRRTTPDT
ncbi:hypothetical protein [Brachybacterium sp. UNK5269]|uniref:hypothetical protein n=1 Tax=Brachybacterium sp. UNK5269 TaxID=3408576 RepID=UPI003BAFC912